MNVVSMRMTALSSPLVLTLWEEREVSSVHVTLDILGMALPATVTNITGMPER